MMKKFLPIYILILLFTASCELPTSGVGSVRGTVYSSDTGMPMAEVAVIYGDSAIYTDGSGLFFYEGIPDGTQALTFIKDGYAKVVNFVVVPDKGEVQCDAMLDLQMSGWAVGGNDSDYGTILYTTDGGMSWVRQGSPSQISNVDLNGVCAISPTACWIVGQYDTDRNTFTIYRTDDAGKNWSSQAKSISGLPLCGLADIVSKDGKKAWAVADTAGYIISTANSGSSWKVANASELMDYYTSITTPDGTHIWACGKSNDGGIMVDYSADAGSSWTSIHLTEYGENHIPESIYAIDTLNIYMAGTGAMGIIHSADGGKTWAPTSFSDFSDICSLDALDKNTLWACGNDGFIFRTEDAFSTHTRMQPDVNFVSGKALDISFLRDGHKGVAVLNSQSGESGELLYSLDSGMSWFPSSTPSNFPIFSVDFIGGSK